MGRMAGARVTGRVLGAVAAAHVLPAGTWLPPVRRAIAPSLCGPGAADHVALTFDDGPDSASTPYFLDALDALGVRATFFCVGEQVRRHPRVAREAAQRGHEIACHGWCHRNQLLRPGPVGAELRAARDLISDVTGRPPRWYRPPYGVLTGQGVLAARRARLTPVLWSVWAKDWTAGVTAGDVLRVVGPGLRGGATILLHDTDAYAQPGSWRATLAALPRIVGACRAQGLRVGPLGAHAAGA
ncbi:polysaccharide deacetylase family protein [Tomitella fengzijianii]|uniref:Polysaccharide deacetylase family protein n=1 Tax=Tomitella fengzijianii TaxID=2597660 RepID=A0A516X6G8_9ACTN|nr:polysaccharide deacetylase family protein [Tomitella fengzijianii]QDQ98668.1 polysaccharide deacetylase family protein [Tomitella fengzijianii]